MFRMSLREMLLLVAMAALAIASLKYANNVWLALVAAVTMIALFVALIVAAVDRGPRQSFAIDFVLTMLAYGIGLTTGQTTVGFGGNVNSKNNEFHWQGRLPTTQLLRYVHMAVDRGGYYDVSTGAEVPNYDPAKDPKRLTGGGFAAIAGSVVGYRGTAPAGDFHASWPLLVGASLGLCRWAFRTLRLLAAN